MDNIKLNLIYFLKLLEYNLGYFFLVIIVGLLKLNLLKLN